MKVIGGREETEFSPDRLDKLDPALVYNVLASHLTLRFVPAPACVSKEDNAICRQTALATNLVNQHMHMLKKVVDQHCLCIGMPSEPILAILASLLMLPVQAGSMVDNIATCYSKLCINFVEKSLEVLEDAVLKGTLGKLRVTLGSWTA